MQKGFDERFDIHSYKWQFVYSNLPLEYVCSICNRILKEPIIQTCCGQVQQCKECVEYIEGTDNTQQCPECEEQYLVAVDKKKWKDILQLYVQCPSERKGCTWIGSINDCEQHLTSNCTFAGVVQCSSDILENHRRDQSVHTNHNQKQDNVDKNYYTTCPHGCKKNIHNYEEHENECLELEIPCDYKYVGCEVTLKRKLMPKHIVEGLQEHTHLQSTCLQSKLELSLLLSQQYAQDSEIGFLTHLEQSENALAGQQQKLKTIQQKEESKQNEAQQSLNQLYTRQKCTIKQVLKSKPNCLWELDRQSIKVQTKVHTGQFCEVWKGLQYGDAQVAVKLHKPGCITSQTFLHEAFILKELEHINILKLLGVSTSEEPIMIVTEYMTHGNLLDLFKHRDVLTKFEKLDILQQTSHGMAHLESLNWIHRAINSRNVLVGDDIKCKISGLELAQKLSRGENGYKIPDSIRTPIKWSAPEVLTMRVCSTKSDVWSFGIINYYGK